MTKPWYQRCYRRMLIDMHIADWDDSFLYWLTSHTLAPAVGFEVLPSARSRLLVSVEIPLVGVMSRSPEERTDKVDPLTTPLRWTTRAHSDARWAGPADLYAPSVSAAYSRSFGKHWGMNLVFDLFYRHTPEPKTFLALGQRLTYQMRYVF